MQTYDRGILYVHNAIGFRNMTTSDWCLASERKAKRKDKHTSVT